MIEELIKEMFDDCPSCHEGYLYSGYLSNGVEECPNCCGEGKIISYNGERLRHLILKGELP